MLYFGLLTILQYFCTFVGYMFLMETVVSEIRSTRSQTDAAISQALAFCLYLPSIPQTQECRRRKDLS